MTAKKEWYLPDPNGEEPGGPYSTGKIIEMLRSGKLRMEQFVWSKSLDEAKWFRFFEVEEFRDSLTTYPMAAPLPKTHAAGMASSKKKVSINYKKSGVYGVENVYRRYPRAPLDAEVIVSSNRTYMRAKVIDISEKGLFARVEDVDLFKKGEDVSLTIRNVPGIGTFSVRGVVIRQVNRDDKKGIGFFFLRISPIVKRQIARYVLSQLNRQNKEVTAA